MPEDCLGTGQVPESVYKRNRAYESIFSLSDEESIKKDGNMLANSVELAKGEYDTRFFVNFTESRSSVGDGKNRWQEGIDAWVNALGDPKFHVPRDTYRGSEQITVTLKEPGDNAQINSNSIQVSADVSSTNDVSKIEVFIDDSKVKEVNGGSINESISIANGSHILKVKVQIQKEIQQIGRFILG